jgi:hypothetical protein
MSGIKERSFESQVLPTPSKLRLPGTPVRAPGTPNFLQWIGYWRLRLYLTSTLSLLRLCRYTLEDMVEKPALAPKTLLFGKVVVYECTACGKSFAIPLLEGAVPSEFPAPAMVRAAFFSHDCKHPNAAK